MVGGRTSRPRQWVREDTGKGKFVWRKNGPTVVCPALHGVCHTVGVTVRLIYKHVFLCLSGWCLHCGVRYLSSPDQG